VEVVDALPRPEAAVEVADALREAEAEAEVAAAAEGVEVAAGVEAFGSTGPAAAALRVQEAGLPSRDVKHCYMVLRGSVWSPGVVARTGFSNESPMHHRLRANGPINATAVAPNNGLSVRGSAADLRRTELFKEPRNSLAEDASARG
jgi:hypothetical protein